MSVHNKTDTENNKTDTENNKTDTEKNKVHTENYDADEVHSMIRYNMKTDTGRRVLAMMGESSPILREAITDFIKHNSQLTTHNSQHTTHNSQLKSDEFFMFEWFT